MVKTERTEVHQMQKAVISAKENDSNNLEKFSNSHFGKSLKGGYKTFKIPDQVFVKKERGDAVKISKQCGISESLINLAFKHKRCREYIYNEILKFYKIENGKK